MLSNRTRIRRQTRINQKGASIIALPAEAARVYFSRATDLQSFAAHALSHRDQGEMVGAASQQVDRSDGMESGRPHPLRALVWGRIDIDGPRGVGISLRQCMTESTPPGRKMRCASRSRGSGSCRCNRLNTIA